MEVRRGMRNDWPTPACVVGEIRRVVTAGVLLLLRAFEERQHWGIVVAGPPACVSADAVILQRNERRFCDIGGPSFPTRGLEKLFAPHRQKDVHSIIP